MIITTNKNTSRNFAIPVGWNVGNLGLSLQGGNSRTVVSCSTTRRIFKKLFFSLECNLRLDLTKGYFFDASSNNASEFRFVSVSFANENLQKVIQDNPPRDTRLNRNEYIGSEKLIFNLPKFTRVRRHKVACFLSPLRLYLLGSGLAGPSDTCSSATHSVHNWSSTRRVRLVRGAIYSFKKTSVS